MAESRPSSDQFLIAASLPRSLEPLETWGFGLTGLLLWVGAAPGAQSELGAGSILVWLPGAIIGILINLQVKRLGEHWPDVAGGTPNYITRLLENYPFLASYTALGYFISWVAVLPINAIILTDLIKANLEPLGITCPDTVLRIGFTLLAFVVAFSGTRALAILHLFLVVPSVALLLLFCVQGLGWLALDPNSPGLLPDVSEFSISMGDWAKWYVIGTYAVYACETASSFVADSRQPQLTLNGLNVAAFLIVPVYLGGSWVLTRLANNPISNNLIAEDNAFLNLLTASNPFWGEFAPLIVTLLVTSGSLLACATAVSNSPRILYQLSQDGLISPVFGVISNQGVLGPGLLLTLFLSLLCLFWGNVPRIVIVTGIGWLFSFVMLHWGLWLRRDRPEVLFPQWSLLFCLFEAVILIVGGIAWDWQDLVIGLLIPILILAGDALLRQAPLSILQPDWWVKHDIPTSKTNVEDFLLFQVGIIVLLVSGATIVSWQLRSQLDLANYITSINLFVVLLLTLVFVGVAIACWTTLPQISAIMKAKDQAERNLTQRQLAEAALRQTNETLEESVKERTADLATANQEISVLNEKLKGENLRMAAELDILKQMQQMILPKQKELEIEGLDIAGFMEPADEVGGDYYDVLHTDGVVTISMGDVTGHGLESGILMLMTQTAVRILKEIREPDPVQFLDTLNRTIYKNVQRMNSDRNLTLVVLNYADGKVDISGQHEETIVVRDGGHIERIDTMDLGFPIGLDNDIANFISHRIVELHPGDGIVLYTDGITEARDIDKQRYGMERLCAVIAHNWQQSAEAIKQAVIEDVRQHIGTQKVFDDITLLVLKQHHASPSAENYDNHLTGLPSQF